MALYLGLRKGPSHRAGEVALCGWRSDEETPKTIYPFSSNALQIPPGVQDQPRAMSAGMRGEGALKAIIKGSPCRRKEAQAHQGSACVGGGGWGWWRFLSLIHVFSTPSKMKKSSVLKTMHVLVSRCTLFICSQMAPPVSWSEIILLQRTGSAIQNKMKGNCFWWENILIETYSSVQFSHSVVSDSLRPHGLQHMPPCPSPTPGVHPNSCAVSRWCHPAMSSSVIPFSCLQSFPASGSFQMSQFFTLGGQIIGVSASASVFPMNIQDWFPLRWTRWISLQSKGLSRVFSNTTVQRHQFFSTQLSL